MKRKAPSAADLGIASHRFTKEVTVPMPKGGFKNTRVVTRSVSLAGSPIRDDDDAEVTPRQLRRR